MYNLYIPELRECLAARHSHAHKTVSSRVLLLLQYLIPGTCTYYRKKQDGRAQRFSCSNENILVLMYGRILKKKSEPVDIWVISSTNFKITEW